MRKTWIHRISPIFLTLILFQCSTFLSQAAPSNAQLKEVGLYPVTDSQFGNCVADGVTDCTTAIQKAMDYAFQAGTKNGPNRGVAFFPSGTYVVTNTLIGLSDREMSRNNAYQLVGTSEGPKPVLLLKPKPGDNSFNGTPTASNPGARKPVIKLGPLQEGNEAMGMANGVRNLEIRISADRTQGAVGLELSGAQDNIIQNVRIVAEGNSFAGLLGLIGTNSVTTGLEIIGGKIGLHGGEGATVKAKWPSFSDVTLTNQSQYAITGVPSAGPLTLTGFKITKQHAPAILTNSGAGPQHSAYALSDGVIEFASDNGQSAIDNSPGRQVTLQNVYVKNANAIIKSYDDTWSHNAGDGFARVEVYGSVITTGNYQSTHVLDGNLNKNIFKTPITTVNTPPPNLLINHRLYPQDFPTADVILKKVEQNDPAYVNIAAEGVVPLTTRSNPGPNSVSAPDYAPAINQVLTRPGVKYVLFPKGIYPIKSPIVLQKDTRIIGVSNFLSEITTHESWSPPSKSDWTLSDVVPVIQTVNDANATSTLAYMKITWHSDVNRARFTGIDWRAGRNSVYLNNITRPMSGSCALVDPNAQGSNAKCTLQYPRAEHIIRDNGGGRFYGLAVVAMGASKWHENFRGLLVSNTTQPLTIYGFDPEDSHADDNKKPQAEIVRAKNVAIRGFKSEDRNAILVHENSDNIYFTGFSGQLEIEFRNIANVLFLNAGAKRFDEEATKWMIREVFNGQSQTINKGTGLSVLKRGTVDVSVWNGNFTPPPLNPWDLNSDGAVNLYDFNHFVKAVTSGNKSWNELASFVQTFRSSN